MRSHCLTLSFCLCALSSTGYARDYYLSASGDDAGPGTQARPWRSVQAVAAARLAPGDRILLQGGGTFTGPLRLGAAHSGTAGKRVEVGSYGDGSAIIDGGTGSAILAEGASQLAIRNLRLRGAGRKTGNTTSGLIVKDSRDVEIERVEVSGFRSSGVRIEGSENVRVLRVRAHQNGYAGISSGGARSRNLYIAYCLSENNPGDPTARANHSGNGIVVAHTTGATVEYCEARYNGWDMPWTGNGPVGIWTYESDRVIIQYCIAHHNRSTAKDGGGFDFDGGVTNSILQGNYSHDNFGSGYLICQYAGASEFANNIVRYNISQDDGLFDHNAGIFVWVGGSGMKSTTVYNNTIFTSKGSAVALDVVPQYANEVPDLRFYNNIFVSLGPQIRGGAKYAKFAGNLYWSVGERGFSVDGWKDFAKWVEETGQEKWNGSVAGVYADPLLRKDGNGLLTDPERLSTLHEYHLLPGSPAIDRGIDLRTAFGLDPGKRDFFGGAIGAGRPDIGAHEFVGSGSAVQSRRGTTAPPATVSTGPTSPGAATGTR